VMVWSLDSTPRGRGNRVGGAGRGTGGGTGNELGVRRHAERRLGDGRKGMTP
jgi:hypothetical protein